MDVHVERLVAGRWSANCYVVEDVERRALVIDPCADVEELLARIEARRLEVAAIVSTHGHHDHVGAAKALRDRLGAPFRLHSADEKLLGLASLFAKLFDGGPPIPIPRIDAYLDGAGDPLSLAGQPVDVIATPGHTAGSVCFGIAGKLFVGDTLLKGKLARVDPKFGNPEQLRDSLRKLCTLDPATVVYPGHGEPTTLGEELRSNRRLLEAIE